MATGLLFWLIYLAVILICIALKVLQCAGRMRMFQKAGEEGWKAWVPLYSDFTLCRLTMGNGWYFAAGLISCAGMGGWLFGRLVQGVYAVEVALSYKREIWVGVLYFFCPWICEMVLGFGNSPYLGGNSFDAQVKDLWNRFFNRGAR